MIASISYANIDKTVLALPPHGGVLQPSVRQCCPNAVAAYEENGFIELAGGIVKVLCTHSDFRVFRAHNDSAIWCCEWTTRRGILDDQALIAEIYLQCLLTS